MNVRSASFRDLARVEEIYRRSSAAESETDAAPPLSAGDSPVPHATLVRLWYAVGRTLSSLVPTAEPSGNLFVAEDTGGEIVGFIQANGVPGQPKAWHIINLCAVAQGRTHVAGERLLTHLVNQGMQHGVGAPATPPPARGALRRGGLLPLRHRADPLP